ncbi:MAG: pyrroline-5-carboxylate reductase [Chloroflexi bacterium]|nr:pyrroline-5-carboxylate reductase [Chloroflexota bacterium]
MSLLNATLAFIGSGVMGEAMMKGLLNRDLVSPLQITASDVHVDRCETLKAMYGVKTTLQNAEAVAGADIVLLSVKPQVMDRVLSDIRGVIKPESLILSIAAGVTIKSIAEGGGNPRVVRAMPNTPGQIGQGMTVWTASSDVDDVQRHQSRLMLGALGDEMLVEDERFLDMATALNGTGPAYVFMFMEALIDVGVHMGLPRRDAERLVLQTVRGSVDFALQSHQHMAEMRNQVTSPGGTSAEAIYHLEKGGLRTVIADGVWAAYRRSQALGEGSKKS